MFAFWKEGLLSSDLALEFFKIRPNIDKAGAEIKVQVKNLAVIKKKKKQNKTNQPCWKISQGKQKAMCMQKKSPAEGKAMGFFIRIQLPWCLLTTRAMRSVCYEALHGDLTQSSITWWRKRGKTAFVSWEPGKEELWCFGHFGTAKCCCWVKHVGQVGQTSMERQLTLMSSSSCIAVCFIKYWVQENIMWLIPLLIPGAYILLLGKHLRKKITNVSLLSCSKILFSTLHVVWGYRQSLLQATCWLLAMFSLPLSSSCFPSPRGAAPGA